MSSKAQQFVVTRTEEGVLLDGHPLTRGEARDLAERLRAATVMSRSAAAALAARKRWESEADRAAATSRARRTFDQKFLRAADGDEARAAQLRSEYYADLASRRHRKSRGDQQ